VSTHSNVQKAIICDNSTNEETSKLLNEHNIPYFTDPGGTHGCGVNKLIEKCTTKYALLVDTDIIFLKNHTSIFQKFKEMDLTLMGKVEGDRGGKLIHNRVNPWHCFINVDHIKEKNIIFFDEGRMRESFKTSKIYDIGSTFLEDIKSNKLKIGDIDLSTNYYYHLEGMSWYKNKYSNANGDTGIDFGGTHDNYQYVELFNSKYTIFESIASKYEGYNIKNMYI
jgi:hypothetical protein